VTATNSKLSFTDQSTFNVVWEGKDPSQEIIFHELVVDLDFLKTFSIQLVDGRDFSSERIGDSSAVLLNEEAARRIGRDDILNSTLSINDHKKEIIGIVKDFNFKSAHKKIEPMIIYMDPSNFYEITVRLSSGNIKDQVKGIENVFKKFNPNRPFEYSFLDEDIDKLYRSEQRISKIFGYFTFLSIFISCLGLLGIVIFVTEQRAKEIALRKIMGASELHLTWILSVEFVVLVILAFFISSPFMFFISSLWLKNFAYKINPGIYLYLIAGTISLIIAWITVGYKSYRASKVNPIEPLKGE
jgi:ABC-type antimicrobial peptide transport system permease subunit